MLDFEVVIKFRVGQLATAKGFKNPRRLSDEAKVPYSVVYKLWHNQQRNLNLDVMEKLCKTLRCKPSQLFEEEPD
jgi:DNA-binding Xre family transcriptional regulator